MNLYVFKSFIIPLLLHISIVINAAIIKGRITDSETHKPISGAVISITGTKTISVSDAKGDYSFNNIKPGTYSLSGSCMGYKNSEPKIINLTTTDSNITIDFNLDPSVIQMKEVVVTSSQNKETNVSARNDEKLAPNVIILFLQKPSNRSLI
jgi:hypothetical protein